MLGSRRVWQLVLCSAGVLQAHSYQRQCRGCPYANKRGLRGVAHIGVLLFPIACEEWGG